MVHSGLALAWHSFEHALLWLLAGGGSGITGSSFCFHPYFFVYHFVIEYHITFEYTISWVLYFSIFCFTTCLKSLPWGTPRRTMAHGARSQRGTGRLRHGVLSREKWPGGHQALISRAPRNTTWLPEPASIQEPWHALWFLGVEGQFERDWLWS